MQQLQSITELINTLSWAKGLLSEMFEKRKSFSYRYDHAVAVLEDERRLERLIEMGIVVRNGQVLELEDVYLQFFEQILGVNEQINVSYINDNIQMLKENVTYYLRETSEIRQYGYLKTIKSVLRKIGKVTLRNIVDLNRNIDNAFKTEPSYRIKIAKLENLDEKRRHVSALVSQTTAFLDGDELTFFKTAPDEEFLHIVHQLRLDLTEARHNLIETQKQIIDFLNQIRHQSQVLEHVRQVKYLKEQFELKNRTDFVQVMTRNNDLCLLPRLSFSTRMSLLRLGDADVFDLLVKISQKKRSGFRINRQMGEDISETSLTLETEDELFVNPDELKNAFCASGNHLFQFVLDYPYPSEISFDERVGMYCQLISLYEEELNITDEFGRHGNLEYAIVYPA